MKLMILITDKGKSNQVVDFMASLNLTTAVTFIGKGTATHEILETLSLTQEDKEVVMGFADDKDIKNNLNKQKNISKKHMTITRKMKISYTIMDIFF